MKYTDVIINGVCSVNCVCYTKSAWPVFIRTLSYLMWLLLPVNGVYPQAMVMIKSRYYDRCVVVVVVVFVVQKL